MGIRRNWIVAAAAAGGGVLAAFAVPEDRRLYGAAVGSAVGLSAALVATRPKRSPQAPPATTSPSTGYEMPVVPGEYYECEPLPIYTTPVLPPGTPERSTCYLPYIYTREDLEDYLRCVRVESELADVKGSFDQKTSDPLDMLRTVSEGMQQSSGGVIRTLGL